MIRIIKKILIGIILFIVVIVSLVAVFFYFDGRLGKGDYFLYYAHPDAIKSRSIKGLYLADTLYAEYDDDFIIAQRIPVRFYSCPNMSTSIYKNKLQYLIIDKNTNKIYGTYNIIKFLEKKNKLGVDIDFDSERNKLVQKNIKNSQHIYNNRDEDIEYMRNYCQEKQEYPIIEY